MQRVSKVFNFYLNSSIHVSLAVTSLQIVTVYRMDLLWDDNLLLFTFFASITGYNFIKYSRLAKWHHLGLTESLRIIQVFSMFSFFAMLFFMIKLDREVLFACVVLGLVTGLYALPIFSQKRNLRSLRGVKIYVIALVWTGVTVLLPLLQAGLSISWDAGILLLQVFLFVLVITLPFDIRDLKYDAAGIGTIPLKLGLKKTKFFGVFLLILVVLLEAFKDKITSEALMSLLVITALAGFFLIVASEKQSKYFASFWVESLPLLWSAMLYSI